MTELKRVAKMNRKQEAAGKLNVEVKTQKTKRLIPFICIVAPHFNHATVGNVARVVSARTGRKSLLQCHRDFRPS